MIQFYLLGFHVQIQPFFWLSCLLLGGGLGADNSQDFINLLNWSLVMFMSIMAHELGHAFAGRHYGARPSITLHALGGATLLPGANFTRLQSILVSAAGPVAGIALGLVFLAALVLTGREGPYDIRVMIHYGLFINFIWTAFNLLPIQPMDGGQILREALGPRRFTLTCWIGAIVGVALLAWAVMSHQYFLAAMAGFMAWMNFKGTKGLSGGVEK